VTTGGDGSSGNNDRRRGFVLGQIGSINDGTSDLYSGAPISALYWDESGDHVIFEIQGTWANSGWTTMNVGGLSFSRVSASFAQVGGDTQWVWNAFYGPTTNPFGIIGTVKTVTFT
jgi:hypothetical protein